MYIYIYLSIYLSNHLATANRSLLVTNHAAAAENRAPIPEQTYIIWQTRLDIWCWNSPCTNETWKKSWPRPKRYCEIATQPWFWPGFLPLIVINWATINQQKSHHFGAHRLAASALRQCHDHPGSSPGSLKGRGLQRQLFLNWAIQKKKRGCNEVTRVPLRFTERHDFRRKLRRN